MRSAMPRWHLSSELGTTSGATKGAKLKVAWLAPYPPERLCPELMMVRRSRAHPASWIVNLADALSRKQDIDLHVVTATSGISKSQTISRDGITFHVIRHTFPFTTRGFPPYLRLDLLTRYARLRRRITETLISLQPDLVHVHGTEFGYGLTALDCKVPTIISIQGVVNHLARISPTLAFRLQAPIETRVIREAKYFGSRTDWANQFIRTLNPAAIIYDLPEAMHPLFFGHRSEHSNPQLLFVGSVEQRKGIADLLKAMPIVAAECPGITLAVVGGGSKNYSASLKQRARDLGVEANIRWLGSKTTAEVAALHANSMILVHPSHLDNSPNSVAEAMASGLPVIATNVGGIPSMIENGITGLLTPARDYRQLAQAILFLLHNEPERKRMASRAREIALQRHLPSSVAEKTMRIYQDMIARESGQLASNSVLVPLCG